VAARAVLGLAVVGNLLCRRSRNRSSGAYCLYLAKVEGAEEDSRNYMPIYE
jgi:hypothetical protein